MADGFIVEVDAREVLKCFDLLGDELAEAYAKEASIETGEAIADEARARVRRAEGVTARNIVSTDHLPEYLGGSPAENPTAAFVYVEAKGRPDNIAIWLNFGTQYIVGDDFMFAAARLEEGPHMRRLLDRLQEACDEACDRAVR